MTDLISRGALLQELYAIGKRENNLGRVALVCECIDKAKEAPAIKPQVVANISGGILQGASSDYPVDLYTLDFEHDGAEEDELITVDGSTALFGETFIKIDPDFVDEVIETILETVDDLCSVGLHNWGGEPSIGAECLLCGTQCEEKHL
jgi:hypothetical protein